MVVEVKLLKSNLRENEMNIEYQEQYFIRASNPDDQCVNRCTGSQHMQRHSDERAGGEFVGRAPETRASAPRLFALPAARACPRGPVS
ncbi:hypothetical protein EVAR_29339_1 [Eumeta japonica]|uniref:Uncharacterized protein n=1 Tax=Eumeta variegata TaxID=151549 RepID=A0A4C1WI83_EUMVA|nr:hypothetical protein EVAR_29339_1 [Eumeta japonica]